MECIRAISYLKFITNWQFAQVIFPHLCWDLNPQTLDDEASVLAIILSLQVRLKGIKVCAKHVQSFARWQFVLNFVNLENKSMECIATNDSRIGKDYHRGSDRNVIFQMTISCVVTHSVYNEYMWI